MWVFISLVDGLGLCSPDSLGLACSPEEHAT